MNQEVTRPHLQLRISAELSARIAKMRERLGTNTLNFSDAVTPALVAYLDDLDARGVVAVIGRRSALFRANARIAELEAQLKKLT